MPDLPNIYRLEGTNELVCSTCGKTQFAHINEFCHHVAGAMKAQNAQLAAQVAELQAQLSSSGAPFFVVKFRYFGEWWETTEEEFDTLKEASEFRRKLICGETNYNLVQEVQCFKRINQSIDYLFKKE